MKFFKVSAILLIHFSKENPFAHSAIIKKYRRERREDAEGAEIVWNRPYILQFFLKKSSLRFCDRRRRLCVPCLPAGRFAILKKESQRTRRRRRGAQPSKMNFNIH